MLHWFWWFVPQSILLWGWIFFGMVQTFSDFFCSTLPRSSFSLISEETIDQSCHFLSNRCNIVAVIFTLALWTHQQEGNWQLYQTFENESHYIGILFFVLLFGFTHEWFQLLFSILRFKLGRTTEMTCTLWKFCLLFQFRLLGPVKKIHPLQVNIRPAEIKIKY